MGVSIAAGVGSAQPTGASWRADRETRGPSVATHVVAYAQPSAASWRADYESGGFEQWEEIQPTWRPERASIVTLPVRAGRHAARFEVRSGDSVPSGGELSQVYVDSTKTGGNEGEEWYYAWSTYVPSGQQWAYDSDWNIITEWHHSGPDCGPPLSLGVLDATPPRLYVNALAIPKARSGNCTVTQHKKWLLPLATDRWMDFVVHVKWSSNPDVGFLELWQDGRLKIPKTFAATLYPGQGVYFKQGFYRAGFSFTNVIYNDQSLRVAGLRDLPRFAQPAHLGTSLIALRTRIERSGRSWEGFLRTHASLARSQGIRGLDWNGTRFYTRQHLRHWLESRGESFGRWASRHRLEASALDSAASDVPYAAIVGASRLERNEFIVTVRSALAHRVSIVIRDSEGRRVGSAAALMPRTGLLRQVIAISGSGKPRDAVVSTRAAVGKRQWTGVQSLDIYERR